MVAQQPGTRRTAVVGLLLLVAIMVAFALLLNRAEWEEKPIVAVRGWTGTSMLQVTVAHSRCPGGDPEVRIEEDHGTVHLRAEHDVSGDCEDIGLRTTVDVALDDVLGDRAIAASRSLRLRCTIDESPSDRCA